MAFEADWGSSTVLDAIRVATIPRFPVPVAARSPRDEAVRDSATPTGGSGRRMRVGDGKSEIRNSKSEWNGRLVLSRE